MSLPPLSAVADVHERLQTVFPEGTANRNYVTREIAAKTVFVMLYIGAVEGAECVLRARTTDGEGNALCRVRRRNRREGVCEPPIWATGIADARRSCRGRRTSRSGR